MITILTTTYNRSEKLSRVYDSLRKQTTLDFKWLVVDDGSTDDTGEYIASISVSSPFIINYISKENGGKHTALNTGYESIDTDWTLILDSDDWLKQDCIETLNNYINNYGDVNDAISFLRVDPNFKVIGDNNPENIDNYLDKIRLSIAGDKAGIHKTKIARKFRFPEFEGEKFMSEMPFFLWFGSKYKTKFINYAGYICEYQEDGLSAKIIENRYSNINSTLFVYEQMYFNKSYLPFRIRAGINWWRFKIGNDVDVSRRPSYILFLFGYALNLIDRFQK